MYAKLWFLFDGKIHLVSFAFDSILFREKSNQKKNS